jgi:hypothetical protein
MIEKLVLSLDRNAILKTLADVGKVPTETLRAMLCVALGGNIKRLLAVQAEQDVGVTDDAKPKPKRARTRSERNEVELAADIADMISATPVADRLRAELAPDRVSGGREAVDRYLDTMSRGWANCDVPQPLGRIAESANVSLGVARAVVRQWVADGRLVKTGDRGATRYAPCPPPPIGANGASSDIDAIDTAP